MTDQQTDDNKLIAERRAKLSAIREQCRANGFPNSFRRENYADELQAKFGEFDKETLQEQGNKVSIAGRIMAKRGPFMLLQDMTGRIQAYADKDTQKALKAKYGALDIGDIIGVAGDLHKSGKGDLYVNMEQYELLTKALRPLPEKFHGLSDQETKYRQRYVDLITSEQTRKTFMIRSKIVNGIRNYLTERDYLEVETPMLQVIPGGATAKPFVTHHNALDIDMYLRIAPELYLKRLVVGGFERVFEINRNFRNEGLSTRHNPEFTMLEFYWAYADFEDNMNLVEDMIRSVAESIGALQLKWGDMDVDLSKPFERLPILDLLKEATGEDLTEATDEQMQSICKANHVDVEDNANYGQMLDALMSELVEPKLVQPTFITDYPKAISPLAKKHRNGNPHLVERFESQARLAEEGDDEAHPVDENFLQAVECGMPPTGGVGIGVDRLVMLFTENVSIKDVILFPAMRTEEQ